MEDFWASLLCDIASFLRGLWPFIDVQLSIVVRLTSGLWTNATHFSDVALWYCLTFAWSDLEVKCRLLPQKTAFRGGHVCE